VLRINDRSSGRCGCWPLVQSICGSLYGLDERALNAVTVDRRGMAYEFRTGPFGTFGDFHLERPQPLHHRDGILLQPIQFTNDQRRDDAAGSAELEEFLIRTATRFAYQTVPHATRSEAPSEPREARGRSQ